MSEEENEEKNLYSRWLRSEERKILNEYEGSPIEEVPEEYREKIETLRSLIEQQKTLYEEVVDFLNKHNGQLMRGTITKNGKRIQRGEMSEEEREESALYVRWSKSKEKKVLEEYEGRPIEEVPEEYRKKIETLRTLIKQKKTVFEEVIEFLEAHDGKLMRGNIKQNGKVLTKDKMTEEQQQEKNLYARWYETEERKILNEYEGTPIEEVPEEYREKIARLREFGLGMKKSKLLQTKQMRDNAKAKNDKAKELEQQVTEQLKKRGKNHEEQ